VEAVRTQRGREPARRLTCYVAAQPVARFESVRLDEEVIGWVLHSGWSSVRGDCVGWAVLDAPLAWPGIRRYRVGKVPIETCSPPLLDNRSLFIDPRQHRYSTRDQDALPPLVSP
jgi:hypothetical protein